MAPNEHSLTHFKQHLLDTFLLYVLKGAKELKCCSSVVTKKFIWPLFSRFYSKHINSEIQTHANTTSPCDARSQGISNHDIDYVEAE